MTWCFKHYNETILKFEAGDTRKRLVSIFMNFRFPESCFRKLFINPNTWERGITKIDITI